MESIVNLKTMDNIKLQSYWDSIRAKYSNAVKKNISTNCSCLEEEITMFNILENIRLEMVNRNSNSKKRSKHGNSTSKRNYHEENKYSAMD